MATLINQIFIQGTAMTYFRRFYMQQSIFEFDFTDIMCSCIYLAIKIEEYNLNLDTFVKKINTPKEITTIESKN